MYSAALRVSWSTHVRRSSFTISRLSLYTPCFQILRTLTERPLSRITNGYRLCAAPIIDFPGLVLGLDHQCTSAVLQPTMMFDITASWAPMVVRLPLDCGSALVESSSVARRDLGEYQLPIPPSKTTCKLSSVSGFIR